MPRYIIPPTDNRPCDHVMAGEQHLEVVDSFRYLDDTSCAAGGCVAAIITRVRAAWGKFRFVSCTFMQELITQNLEKSVW